MSQKPTTEIGLIDGQPYTIVHEQYKNIRACEQSIANKWRYFLFVGCHGRDPECYIGDYRLKAEAMEEAVNRLSSLSDARLRDEALS